MFNGSFVGKSGGFSQLPLNSSFFIVSVMSVPSRKIKKILWSTLSMRFDLKKKKQSKADGDSVLWIIFWCHTVSVC